ncbi:two-partner secretion domain-containing protein [Planctobacterium marinum]|uniref:two-partner secretion domain-containing protein n=1 Tax=Planctobacterium marinum TaxID=1631968 RepID=UPI001E506987|nr:filamentous hemagglutinin N-terminal domain-containing protein [Planctobacterium marinum]MCC2607875.1 filamentous hemagglutinin N-terminal domain-containing protein [Planctobacterium marinum]
MLSKSILNLALSSALLSTSLTAQVVTDGSMGVASALQGPDYIIEQSLGTLVGNNLFHSFTQFDVLANQSALFTGADNINNVISRVTGGTVSQIQGTVKSEIGNADFYFINPAGIVFSENAKVDVPGALYVSTADELQFANGETFSASTDAASTLSVAAPETFGFLTPQTGVIRFENARVKIETSRHSQFSAAHVQFNNAQLKQDGGQLQLIAVGDAAATLQIATPQRVGNGRLSMDNSGIKLEGNGGGELNLTAAEINTYRANIVSGNNGETDAQVGIRINAEDVTLVNSLVKTETTSSGRAGDIAVTARNFTLTSDGGTSDSRSVLSSESKEGRPPPGGGGPGGPPPPPPGNAQSNQFGASGDINLQISNSLKVLNNATISNVTQENGAGGNMLISASELEINSGQYQTDVGIATLTSGTGQGGSLNIDVQQGIQLLGNGQINAMTLGDGDAGNININAGSLTIVENETSPQAAELPGIQSLSGRDNDFNNAPRGSSGDINLNIEGDLTMQNGGYIVSVTVGNGDAGNINIQADGLNLISEAGQHPITIGSNTLGPQARGDAGDITINASGAINLQGSAFITTLSDSAGDAGDMTVSAQSLSMSGSNDQRKRSGINSSTTGPGAHGNAGTIIIGIEQDIHLVNGANITSDTENNGNAGNIFIAADSLFMAAQEDSEDTGISSSATSKEGRPGELMPGFVASGNAANIDIKLSGDMQMLGEAAIKTEGESRGNAGNIAIEAANLYMQGGELESKAEGEGFRAGDAGDVSLHIAGNVTITDGGAIASDSFHGGIAGNVTINAGSLAMADFGSITSTAALTPSDAGNINILVAGDMSLTTGANIVSDSIQAEKAGIINIAAQNLTLSGAGLPTRISSTTLIGRGDAGEVNINVADTVTLTAGGQITSSSLGATGNAGEVNITASQLLIDAQNQVSLEAYLAYVREEFEDIPEEFDELPQLDDDDLIAWAAIIDIRSKAFLSTGISSVSDFNAIGDAGLINIEVDNLTLKNGAEINTSSQANGDAGDIFIATGDLLLSHSDRQIPATRISSQVGLNSQGAAGNITIAAQNTMTLSGGVIAVDTAANIHNDEKRATGSIQLSADALSLNDQAAISSGSTGNVAAGRITLNINDTLQLNNARITSSADNADAGGIALNTTQLFIDNSLVTTSVSNAGNGGNIAIAADFILMDNGFIQGNTGGADFSGGDISIDADFLIVSEQNLLTGGEERLVFVPNSGANVIQAAAPDGVSGVVNIGALEFDLSDELASIGAEILQLDNLDNNPCNSSAASTLASSGKGGLIQQPDAFNSPVLSAADIRLRLAGDKAAQSQSNHQAHNRQLTTDRVQCQKPVPQMTQELGAR